MKLRSVGFFGALLRLPVAACLPATGEGPAPLDIPLPDARLRDDGPFQPYLTEVPRREGSQEEIRQYTCFALQIRVIQNPFSTADKRLSKEVNEKYLSVEVDSKPDPWPSTAHSAHRNWRDVLKSRFLQVSDFVDYNFFMSGTWAPDMKEFKLYYGEPEATSWVLFSNRGHFNDDGVRNVRFGLRSDAPEATFESGTPNVDFTGGDVLKLLPMATSSFDKEPAKTYEGSWVVCKRPLAGTTNFNRKQLYYGDYILEPDKHEGVLKASKCVEVDLVKVPKPGSKVPPAR